MSIWVSHDRHWRGPLADAQREDALALVLELTLEAEANGGRGLPGLIGDLQAFPGMSSNVNLHELRTLAAAFGASRARGETPHTFLSAAAASIPAALSEIAAMLAEPEPVERLDADDADSELPFAPRGSPAAGVDEQQHNRASFAESSVREFWAAKRVFGRGVTVAVIDSGCDRLHPDLAGQVVASRDFTPRAEAGAPDYGGHGTHCCGIAAALRNDRGMVGVAPEAKLIVAKTNSGQKGVPGASYAQKARAIRWCAEQGADIISMSWGNFKGANDASNRFYGRALSEVGKAGVLLLAATGNAFPRERGLPWPASHPDVLAVGNWDARLDQLRRSSGRGDGIFCVAPGTEYYSTAPGGGYERRTGSSMACPFVAGVLALLMCEHTQQHGRRPSRAQCLERLKSLASDQGTLGWDERTGWGVVRLM